MRRLLLTGVVVFIFPNTTAQPAVSCLLAVYFAIVIALWWQLYAALMDTRISVLGSITVFFSMFLSLIVKVEANTYPSRQDARVFTVTLIILNVLLVVSSLLQLSTSLVNAHIVIVKNQR
jgi:hypothetical protein